MLMLDKKHEFKCNYLTVGDLLNICQAAGLDPNKTPITLKGLQDDSERITNDVKLLQDTRRAPYILEIDLLIN